MTATHYCEQCSKKTAHVVGQAEIEDELFDALRCIVCGDVGLITIKREQIVKPRSDVGAAKQLCFMLREFAEREKSYMEADQYHALQYAVNVLGILSDEAG